ncbi:hypothetical protein [Conexibacter woesei]|uniref:Secreted protein n=1 Tax=Conexibacter woesei (strain DSM 14684 / CCUG 47730 / CIP 108061 / JCM 11494 / NBRC 100937 / ID131577) TaxID=469383 RepID=D3F1V0_CONWI|nr:hypothetical protein [Conexibacter woesei]ADB54131.1 hypothetical protein Cwoe_5730 [Conexibacter woesei DSM 14684]
MSSASARPRAVLFGLAAAGALTAPAVAAGPAAAAPAGSVAWRAAALAAPAQGGSAAPVALAAANAAACRTAKVTVTVGRSAALALDCRAGVRWVARGRGAVRVLVSAPRHGRLTGFDRRAGRVRYAPRAGFAGTDALRFTVRRDGRTYRGTIRIRVVRAAAPTPKPKPKPRASAPQSAAPPGGQPPAPVPPTPPGPQPPGPAPEQPPDDGLPPQLPPAPNSYAAANWTPTAYDSCPTSVHERFSVIGPDGKRYPTWHPPTATDPATGRSCTFGHEHGRDPRGSDIRDWVADHLAAPAASAYAGIPFGLATESLDVYAAANPGTRARHEDHVGYKVDWENDVRLLARDGSDLGVACDYLVSVHQGSHSPDALSNNVHELLYAVRCDDGTELISDTVSRFGAPGEYARACAPGTTVATTDNGYPSGAGRREIPDRACVEQTTLVPAGSTTSAWALYEKWSASNELRTAGGQTLAAYDPAFGVFDPSRYGNAAGARGIGRTLDLCWEVEPNGDRARGSACDLATGAGSIAIAYDFGDPRSPFDGTHRDVYLRETTLRNAGGTRLYWTDPYGGKASTEPFAGALCQLVGTVDTSSRPPLQERVFGRNRPNDDAGVHAPN